MKYLFIVLLIFLSACEPRKRDTENLPWKTTLSDTGVTQVFGINVGETTLKELSIRLRNVAETAIFETDKGKLNLEAYFGKTTIGLLEGRIIADLDVDEEWLQKERDHAKDREPTPNNNWKYTLSEESAMAVLDKRVWRFVYMPTGQYEEKQIKFFGVPEETVKVTETAEYRLFPSKGIALLWDKDGGEIFYYVAPKDFARLKTTLPMEVVRPNADQDQAKDK